MRNLLYDVQEKIDGAWHSWGKYDIPDILLRAIEYHLSKAGRSMRHNQFPELRAIPVFETEYHCE